MELSLMLLQHYTALTVVNTTWYLGN